MIISTRELEALLGVGKGQLSRYHADGRLEKAGTDQWQVASVAAVEVKDLLWRRNADLELAWVELKWNFRERLTKTIAASVRDAQRLEYQLGTPIPEGIDRSAEIDATVADYARRLLALVEAEHPGRTNKLRGPPERSPDPPRDAPAD